MLSGFQEAAQKVEKQNEFALVPLFRFYDTVHSFLDGSIRNVIDRCSKAVENHDGLEPMDVDVLKLLYLIRYVNEDMPANLDNLVILMADDIRLEKVAMREKLRGSLDRLIGQNYIGRTGDTYNFLTDEEQDIQKEINLTQVDTGAIVGDIAKIIFGIIYDAKKFRYGKCDFPFDQMVDNTMYGIATGGMRLRFLTAASDATEKTEFRLMNSSKGSEAIVVLGDTPYYESLEASMKIRKYVKQRNVSQMPKSAQDIIRGQQEEATKYEAEASKALVEAIENAKFYADGEHLDIKSGNAKAKIDQTMEYLVSHVYSKLDLIGKNADTDADILAVLSGADYILPEADPNRDAEAAVEEYLEMQAMHHLPTSMADVQSKFSSIPYGWKEIDIAYVVARLIVNQKVTIKYAGTTIQPDNAKLPDMLRKKSEVGKTSISKRVVVSATKMKAVRDLLRDYFDVMDVPADEDGLVKFIADEFGNQLQHYNKLNEKYDDAHKYPDQTMVRNAITAAQEALNQKKDNIALIDYLLKKEDDLFDQKDAMGNVETFFKSQVGTFDDAARLEHEMQADLDRIAQDAAAYDALNKIRLIITVPSFGQKFNYKRIPELNGLMQTVRTAHDQMLDDKRSEILETLRQCMEATHTAANGDPKALDIVRKSDAFFDGYKAKIASCKSLALLDGMIIPLSQYKDETVSSIEIALAPPTPKPVVTKKDVNIPAVKPKKVKSYSRQILFPAKTLRDDADIDAYVEKIREQLRKKGSHTIIDMVTVHLDIKKDCFFAEFSNLGLSNVPITDDYPEKFDRLLCGGIWCIVQLEYESEGDSSFGIEDFDSEPRQKKQKDVSPISIRKLTPIQMPHIDIEEVRTGRKAFTQDEWMDVMLRSCGYEPEQLNQREKWLLLARMLPLVENNFNLCELGPRSTGKSHIYKEISPNSILVSGGQTTVANLFYNMGRKTVGLVGLWDCVAFDEVAGIKFKDKDGIQIMKDYMASGSFARGKEEKAASASMVFVGNINQSVDVLLKTSSLFDPFPPEMGTDTAFLDRLHCYIPGWEIPKFRPEHFTNDYGFITDYLAEFIRELRKEQYGDALDKYFRLGKNLNQRDTIAVRKIVGGYVKLLYPDGEFTKEQLEEILVFALEMRRRVKEQLKKLGGMEFYDVNFSYIDLDTFEEKFVSVPEQGGGKLIPDGMCNPGQIYTVSRGKSGMIGVFRLESQMLPGSGKFERTGLGSDRDCKESTNTAFNFLKANGKRISGGISTASKDYIINYQDLQGIGMTGKLALPTLIALCSIALGRPTVSTLAVLGEISISGTILKVDELANSLQVCLDSGAKKVLLPITSAADLGTVPPELVGSFNLIFYSSAEDAVFKALGVE